jgi:transposase
MEITTIGIDLAKSVFAVRCADDHGKVVLRKTLRRAQVLQFLRQQPCSLVGMEACGGAHHWARAIGALGHQVRLMSPALVAPYRKGSKHDRNDADAICEAVRRGSMRFVAPKSVAQQDLLALPRIRARLLKQRIALSNQIRALLNERGVTMRTGAAGLRAGVAAAIADESNFELSGALRVLLGELLDELRGLELRVKRCDLRLERAAKSDERSARLLAVPGVGPMIASALVATVGDAHEFKSGRELSAYLGLTPRQHSSGGKTVMLGISKHGDRYLRTLLIHGARATLYGKRWRTHPRGLWAARLSAARGPNVAAVALANHNARVLGALLKRGDRYRPQRAVFRPGPPADAALKGVRAQDEKLLVEQSSIGAD